LSSPHAGQLPPLTLVLGGARSGKSRFAEALVEGAATCGTYCATAEAKDHEMAARIAAHRARRDNGGRGLFWRTTEAPLAIAETIATEANPERPLLIDCLTLWLSNLMMAEAPLDAEFARCRAALRDAAGPIVLVANEVGLGLVPDTPLGRHFRDEAGRLNQEIAALADRVVFIAAGLPLVLKGEPISPSPPFRGEREGPALESAPSPRPSPPMGEREKIDGAEPCAGSPRRSSPVFSAPAKPASSATCWRPPPAIGSRSSSTSSANSASTASCCSAAAMQRARRRISSSWRMAACAAPLPTISCRP
jgi:adenosylcobinamide kinase/adenosylcobinamide-phosphate guanylyltransferase